MKVKLLEWEMHNFFNDMGDFAQMAAETPFGFYRLTDGKLWGGNEWIFSLNDIRVEGFQSEDAAKTAAQADYERRIISTLA